jgi:hypothetical protein
MPRFPKHPIRKAGRESIADCNVTNSIDLIPDRSGLVLAAHFQAASRILQVQEAAGTPCGNHAMHLDPVIEFCIRGECGKVSNGDRCAIKRVLRCGGHDFDVRFM